jgi:capsule polysaccharide export protein KpsE/RkpR
MKNDNNKRTQRTPEQMIADTEAKLERLRLKQAKEVAQTDPEVQALYDQREELRKALREAKKLLGEGPQSGAARIAKHEAWIAKIQEEMVMAEGVLMDCESLIAEKNAAIQSKILQISA